MHKFKSILLGIGLALLVRTIHQLLSALVGVVAGMGAGIYAANHGISVENIINSQYLHAAINLVALPLQLWLYWKLLTRFNLEYNKYVYISFYSAMVLFALLAFLIYPLWNVGIILLQIFAVSAFIQPKFQTKIQGA